MPEPHRHSLSNCRTLAPGIMKCCCGQLFAFVQKPNHAGRYRKVEELTDEDVANFSPDMERDFLEFVGRR